MASLPNDPNLLNKCLKNQCKATQEVKDQYDKILRQKEQHVQLLIGLQQKGYFLDTHEASGKVKSVSDVGKSVEFPKRKLVEESLLLNKRMILIEIEALKQQLRDLNEDKATISNIKHEAESSEVKKNFEDEFHEERIATLLNEIQTLYEDLRRNLLEKEKASKLLSFEKSNAKHVGMELSKLLGDESGAVDVDSLMEESRNLWTQLDVERCELKNSSKRQGSAFWTKGSNNKALHLEDISKLLNIVKKEKILGPEGTEGLQKMSLALLEAIYTKSNILHSVETNNRVQGSRLSFLEKAFSSKEDGVKMEGNFDPNKISDLESCNEDMNDPTEIEFEQPQGTSCGNKEIFSALSSPNRKVKKC